MPEIMFANEKIVTIQCVASRSGVQQKDFKIFIHKNLEDLKDTFNIIFELSELITRMRFYYKQR